MSQEQLSVLNVGLQETNISKAGQTLNELPQKYEMLFKNESSEDKTKVVQQEPEQTEKERDRARRKYAKSLRGKYCWD